MTLKPYVLLLIGLFALQSGCSQITGKKSAPAPLKALKAVTPTIKASTDWQIATGSAMGENKVHPFIDKQYVFVAGGTSASAWQKSNGKMLWRSAIGETISAGVNGNFSNSNTVNTNQVFIGTTNGNAISLDAKTGKILWIERLSSEILSVSASANNRVIFRTVDGKLHALQVTTGELVWQRSQRPPALSQLGAGVPILVPPLVIAGFDNGKVAAYNIENGQGIWEAILALPRASTEPEQITDVDGKIKQLGNALFAASMNGSSTGINIENGKKAWSRAYSTPTGVNANQLGLYSSDDKGNVWKYDPQTGEPVWSMDDLQRRLPSVPAIVGSSDIVITDKQGNIHWINATNGKFSARSKGDPRGYSIEPEVDGNSIFALGKGGILTKVTKR
ncbi:outer membrane protein assembly factor BamB [Cocleimonas flava]|uniref:Outer membrane protein assembly factor BamB n=1 Tax=Cocleimonas flava TaxID=634765 RepID=A0A4R1EWE2_9GAMM|nr:PQQ-binding-like beta-propeller repeat protein [Cocleimonas flava]TCJ85100.1 Beta-barrel assembly machine subunit BamB [Cocleimonas flava]